MVLLKTRLQENCLQTFGITDTSGSGIPGTTGVSDIRPPENLMIELTWEGLAGAGQAEWREKSIPGRGNSVWKVPEMKGG